MTSSDRSSPLTGLARRGFARLTEADALLDELAGLISVDRE